MSFAPASNGVYERLLATYAPVILAEPPPPVDPVGPPVDLCIYCFLEGSEQTKPIEEGLTRLFAGRLWKVCGEHKDEKKKPEWIKSRYRLWPGS